jgi:hypothetical protein
MVSAYSRSSSRRHHNHSSHYSQHRRTSPILNQSDHTPDTLEVWMIGFVHAEREVFRSQHALLRQWL